MELVKKRESDGCNRASEKKYICGNCITLRGLYRIFLLRWFLRLVEALPSGSSSKKAIRLLTENEIVGLFPEFHPVKVRIGKPKYLLKEHGDVIEDIRLQEGVHKIRNAVKEMLYAG